ncbi:hypothetical protein CLAVI_000692 [Candidatus Clavichlamydia salmonicola]|uniref:signal peptidase II n=1 Tax=Candidatus Clavichlamydia salmonicola TaxID=469812 RepID=UPI001891C6BA|nr:signal peptidase II [Candidatus Clavichlamydia salmonicola]MBF5051062.1 hypothetical protein [Candidatus Clavichlamydia salmonicola]
MINPFSIRCFLKSCPKYIIWILGSSFLFFFADFFFKVSMIKFLGMGKECILFNDLNIQLSIFFTNNYGAAWGLFSSFPKILTLVRCIAIIMLFINIFLYKKKIKKICLTLIWIGALSNIIDVFIHGHVIDFIKISIFSYTFPIFNTADALICLGSTIFLISALNKK